MEQNEFTDSPIDYVNKSIVQGFKEIAQGIAALERRLAAIEGKIDALYRSNLYREVSKWT